MKYGTTSKRSRRLDRADDTARDVEATAGVSAVALPMQPHFAGMQGAVDDGIWARRILTLGIVALLAAAGAYLYLSMQTRSQFTTVPGGGDRTYSYYHDKYFDSDSYSPQYDRGGGLIDGGQEWEYEGPYQYGSYGSKGMKDRSEGKARDKVFAGGGELPNVFDTYGLASDPTAGEPVGDAWAAFLDPTYSPYAGYSNPYANRIRMAYGPGVGQGALQQYEVDQKLQAGYN